MNPASNSRLISIALVVVGLGVAGGMGLKLLSNEEFNAPLNPFGINRSPYGEVFAMAMQGPINTYITTGLYGLTPDELAIRKRQLAAENPDNPQFQEPVCDSEATCSGCELHPAKTTPSSGILGRIEGLVDEMHVGHIRRTNSLPANPKLQEHLKNEAEKKLRFAYQLDPSHYANYAALHFFLAEGLSGRKEVSEDCEKLAEQTIEYCLGIDYDPRPALTAAAASTHLLHLMFATEQAPLGPAYSSEEMIKELARLDRCIDHFVEISEKWEKNGNWKLISNRRLEDCFNRYEFIIGMREAALKTIQRIRSTYAK